MATHPAMLPSGLPPRQHGSSASATPAPRPARIGSVTTTPPPHGSMRRLTRRARRLRRHSTRVGPLGSASISDRGNSILRRQGQNRADSSTLRVFAAPAAQTLRCLRQLHAARIERSEQFRLLLAGQPQMRRTHVVPRGIAGVARHQCLRCRDRRRARRRSPCAWHSESRVRVRRRRCSSWRRPVWRSASSRWRSGDQPALPRCSSGRSSVSSPA